MNKINRQKSLKMDNIFNIRKFKRQFLAVCLLAATGSLSFAAHLGANSRSFRTGRTVFNDKQIAVTPPAEMEAIRAKIKKQVESGEAPSVVVLVSKNGKIIWEEAFGWADRERKVIATSQTVYPLASTSKSITSTVLMTLAQKGKINLDDAAENYLGDAKLTFYRGKSSDLKVRDLINSTGGIPHQWQFYYPEDAGKQLTLAERIKRYGIVVFPPGKFHTYSNFSFGIAEQIISQVAGQNLNDYARRELFAPLGMKNTFLGFQAAYKNQIAIGYDFQNKPVTHTDFEPKGGAGFFSSGEDLMRYGMFHLKNEGDWRSILSDKMLDAIHKKPNPDSPNSRYVAGWGYLDFDDYYALLSNGSVSGSGSSLMLIPSEKSAIVCLTNSSKGNDLTDQIAFEIANVLKPDFGDRLKRKIAEVEALEKSVDYKPTEQFVGEWEGKIKTYSGEVPITMNFDANGRIYVKIKGQMETLLNNVRLEGGMLRARFSGNIPTEDAMSKCHRIDLQVVVENGEMYGVARAETTGSKNGFGLPSYIELKRR